MRKRAKSSGLWMFMCWAIYLGRPKLYELELFARLCLLKLIVLRVLLIWTPGDISGDHVRPERYVAMVKRARLTVRD